MHKISPWLRGEYSGQVNEETSTTRKPVVVRHGLDSTVTQTLSISLGPSGNKFMVCSASEKGVKRSNEDVVLMVPSLRLKYGSSTAMDEEEVTLAEGLDAGVLGIIDGHGGRRVADWVQTDFPKILYRQLAKSQCSIWSDPDAFGTLLAESFMSLDRGVLQSIPTAISEGCVLTVLLIPLEAPAPDRIYCANVGDAGAYLWRQGAIQDFEGPLGADTKDAITMADRDEDIIRRHAVPLMTVHKPYSVTEKERIMAAGATIERGRVNGLLDVSRSIGDVNFQPFGISPIPSVSYFDFESTRDDLIVLFSDGMNVLGDGDRICQRTSATMTSALKQQLLQSQIPAGTETIVPSVLRATVMSMIEEAVSEYKCQDNCTMIILQREAQILA